MKHLTAACLALGVGFGPLFSAAAMDVTPPTTLADISGEWVGQCETGHFFRLVLNPDGTGRVAHVPSRWSEERDPYVSELDSLQLEGNQIHMKMRSSGRPVVLEGDALDETMSLRVRGLFRGSSPRLHLVRSAAWTAVVDHLRGAHAK